MALIGINAFAWRHTRRSPFSYYAGTWAEVLALVEKNFPQDAKGPVVTVNVPPEGFFSGVVELRLGMKLKVEYTSRQQGEVPAIQVRAKGKKIPARHVDIIIYSHEALGNEATTSYPWEIVSINARTTEKPEPMDPTTMARNFFGMPGGTKAEYTAEQFARAILYWNAHALVQERK